MSHYVVTTAQHREPLRGDSAADWFCTRAVAQLRFDDYVEAGETQVRLIRWTEGEPFEMAGHALPPPPAPAHKPCGLWPAALPQHFTAALRWLAERCSVLHTRSTRPLTAAEI